MKLTLEHLCCYLPYGLKLINQSKERETVLHGMTINMLFLGDWKPCLRPFKDVIKPIEGVIPAELMWSVESKEEDNFKTFGTIPDYWKSCMAVKPTDHDWRTVRILFAYHFDVFGLIDAGLAININDIQVK